MLGQTLVLGRVAGSPAVGSLVVEAVDTAAAVDVGLEVEGIVAAVDGRLVGGSLVVGHSLGSLGNLVLYNLSEGSMNIPGC